MKAVVKWLGKGVAFAGTTPEGHRLVLSGPLHLNQGEDSGPRPIEVLLHALAACISVDAIVMLQGRGAEILDYQVDVTGVRGTEGPRPIENIELSFTISGRGMSEAMVRDVLQTSLEQESGVANTLKSRITWTVKLKTV